MRLRALGLVALLLVGGWSCSRDPNVAKQKYLESGNRYFQKGRYKEAVIMYRNALGKDRRFGEAYYRLGLAELRMGRSYMLDAIRALRRAVELQKGNTDAQAKLADILLLAYLGDPRKPTNLRQEIDSLANLLLEQDPKSIDGLRLRGYLLLRADNKYKEAIEVLGRAQQIRPFEPGVTVALAQAMLLEGQGAEAEKLGLALIQKEKTFTPVYDLLFRHYMRTNRLEEAGNILNAKAANNPKNALALLELATFYAGTQRRTEMQAALEKMIARPQDFPTAYALVGDFYRRLREFDAATRYYQKGIQADSKQAPALRLRIAETLVAQDRRGEAMQALEEILKNDPRDDNAKAMRASLMIDTAHPDQVRTAITELQALVSRMPRNAVLRFNLARALAAKGDFIQAQTQLQEAVKINPSFIPAKLALARISLSRPDFGAALQATQDILELDPRNTGARLIRAEAHIGTRDFGRAREQIMEALKQDPGSAEAVLHLAILDLNERRYKEAEEVLGKLYRSRPGDLRAVMALSEVYALQSQFDKGIELLSAELAKHPERVDLRIGVANLQVRTGQYDAAVAHYQKLLESNPKSTQLLISIGETYRRKGDIASAVTYFRKGKELSPNDPTPYVPLAVSLDSLGKKTEARGIYEQILKLQPDNPIALNNLAYMIAETGGDLDRALGMAQRAKQKLPQDLNVADTLGWIYIKKNLSDNAIEIFRDLVTKQPRNSTYRFHLAMALFQKGDKPQARKEAQSALQSKPSPEEAAQIKEFLARLS
jgi:tetratricopeptide (TPR) repeat protein